MSFETVEWKNGDVVLIDQRKLPVEETYLACKTLDQVADAIKTMVVRGAPAIGVTAALGLAQVAHQYTGSDLDGFDKRFHAAADTLAATRPTAVNLFWGIERMKRCFAANRAAGLAGLRKALIDEAVRIREEDIEVCKRLGRFGADLLGDKPRILTHCNAGALATAGYGTALGVVRAAAEAGKSPTVLADETRPFLQGARLTAWELMKDSIPVTLITDNMAGHMMSLGRVDCVVVGTDRVAANGDVANKIGTYTVAVLAHRHGLPFYVAAPTSTIDLDCPTGADIPIEQRDPAEVTHVFGNAVAPQGVVVANPAFDVTPHELVTAIVTEKGVATAPYSRSLRELVGRS
ncbi:MAG: S-methyl-5-thioribose-1-phosphate isomerase [Deltaproteobacteria bacterium]|nr:S-methyl-5-thioribose-1-phosphate isomerase [Deltaproteobacteria bacterium]